jgi:hypothetical protein
VHETQSIGTSAKVLIENCVSNDDPVLNGQAKIVEKYASDFLNGIIIENGVSEDVQCPSSCFDDNPLNSSLSTESSTSLNTLSVSLVNNSWSDSNRRHSIDTIERHNKPFSRRHSLHNITEYKNSYRRSRLDNSEKRITSTSAGPKKKLILNQFRSSSIGFALNSNGSITEERQTEKTVQQYAKLTLKNILKIKTNRRKSHCSVDYLKKSPYMNSFVESILIDGYKETMEYFKYLAFKYLKFGYF